MTITTTSFTATLRYATGDAITLCFDPKSGGPDLHVTINGAHYVVPRRFLPALADITGNALDAAMGASR